MIDGAGELNPFSASSHTTLEQNPLVSSPLVVVVTIIILGDRRGRVEIHYVIDG